MYTDSKLADHVNHRGTEAPVFAPSFDPASRGRFKACSSRRNKSVKICANLRMKIRNFFNHRFTLLRLGYAGQAQMYTDSNIELSQDRDIRRSDHGDMQRA